MKKLMIAFWVVILSIFLSWGILFSIKKYVKNSDAGIGVKQQEKNTSLQVPEKIATTKENVVKEIDKEEENTSLSLLVKSDSIIDEEMGRWLLDQYKEETEEILKQIESGQYKGTMWYEQTGKSLFVLRDEYKGYLDSPEVMKEHLIYTKDCGTKDYVSLSFAGDVSFSDDYLPSQNYTNQGIAGAFSQDIQDRMQEADIFMVNNEFCYSTGGTALSGKGYCFRANPDRVTRLEEMGVDIVSIANNHAYDYGEEAFIDTLNTLNDANMPYVGGGMNLEDARNHIVYFIANGIKIGYIAATQIERDTLFTQPATENSAGVVRCYEPELVNEMIANAKENCDFVIVYPHWGTEKVAEIQEDERQLAYAFIDAGADVVIGGHSHCLQGVEYYKGVPIFYSLSNFSFSSKVIDSSILNLQVDIHGLQQARYIPCMENGGKTTQCDLGGENYKRIVKHLNEISANASIDDSGIVISK